MPRNRVGSLADKHGAPAAGLSRGPALNEKRPRKTEPSSPVGAGNEIRAHDFNLGNVRLAPTAVQGCLEHQATAALQHLAGDPRSVVTCQERHGFGDILGPTEAPERRLSNHAIEHFLRYAGAHVCFR